MKLVLKKIIVYLVFIVPFIAFWVLVVAGLGWHWGFDLLNLALFCFFYLITSLGVTAGYHRLLTHPSYKTKEWIKWLLTIMGSMAIEGSVLTWCARHREHHKFTDKEGDPHSPLHGWWHAHFGFLATEKNPDVNQYVPDLAKDKVLVYLDKTFPLWALLSLFLPMLIVFCYTGSQKSAFIGFLWTLARICFVHNMTWSINSICHISGKKQFETDDESRNNWLVSLISLGEGHHNAHHAFPNSARHGLLRWQIDLTWYFIKLLESLGLAWDVRVPTLDAMEAKRRK